MASQSVHELVYVSAATAPMNQQELEGLLLVARANNKRVGITGLLAYHAGSFLQIIEGDPPAVELLFSRIERDKRHHRAVVLSRRGVHNRSFGDWSMGFVRSTTRTFAELPGFSDIFRRGLAGAQISANAGHARDLILAFRDGRLRQHVSF